MNAYKIGMVDHYYDKIKVAVIRLSGDLAVGEKVMFERGGEELFKQTIDSMQIDYEKVEQAKAGDIIGIKTKDPIKEGSEVFKLQV